MTDSHTCYADDDTIQHIDELEAEIKRLRARDGSATINVSYDDGVYPFQRVPMRVVDFGVADNIYMVELPPGYRIIKTEEAER